MVPQISDMLQLYVVQNAMRLQFHFPKEIQYIRNYLDLEKLRPESLKLTSN